MANSSLGGPFYFLVPEGRRHWGDSLGVWLLPAALLVALALFLLFYTEKPKPLALQGPKQQQKTFEIMPEPVYPQTPSLHQPQARPRVQQPRAHPLPKESLPKPASRPRPQPIPQQAAPAPQKKQEQLPRAPETLPAAPSEQMGSNSAKTLPHIDMGQLNEQMDQAARAITSSPALPKFHNPESPAADFYIAGWIQKLERIGDLNYPGTLTGELKVKVVLNPDGSLQRIIMVQPSGNAKLDAAAERIIRLSFPYSPFSSQLKQQTQKIEIPLNMHFLGVRQVNAWR